MIIKSTTVQDSPWVSPVVRSGSVLLYSDTLWSFITPQPQNDVSHTSLPCRRMSSDTIVTLFKGKTIRFFVAKWPYTVLSFRLLDLNPAGNSFRWRCVISPRWISACLRLGVKRTTLRPKGSIKIRPCLQLINGVFSVYFFVLYFPCPTCQNQAESSSKCLPVKRLKR